MSIDHGLGTRTIAGFVGDNTTVVRLRQLGVDDVQGCHLAHPCAVGQNLPYLAASRARLAS